LGFILKNETKWKKETVLAMVNQLPSKFELEDLIEKLILIETIEAVDKRIDKGEFYTQEQMEERVKKS